MGFQVEQVTPSLTDYDTVPATRCLGRQQKNGICRNFKPSSGLEPETPSSTHGNGFRLFSRGFAVGRFAADCHWLRLLGSINAPSL
jgi:hypothetical protein